VGLDEEGWLMILKNKNWQEMFIQKTLFLPQIG